MTSNWDADLPNLAVENVRIQADSLADAWKNLSTDYLLRSVLLTSDRVPDATPFDFESDNCRVRDIYDVLAATYRLDWVKDRTTGVNWFIPVDLNYKRLLSTDIKVAADHFGLPMQSGILEPLGAEDAIGISVKQWGSLFQNAFNYPVDIPAGEHTLRDMLNLCCLANPTKTFHLTLANDSVFVTAVNLTSDQVRPIPTGARHLWNTAGMQGSHAGEPTQSQLATALSHPDPQVRHAARNYLEAVIWSIPEDPWANDGLSTDQALWACLAVTSIMVRTDDTTHQASIQRMQLLATDDFLTKGEAGLAALTALDLARLTKSAKALDIVKQRPFEENQLRGVTYDACRIASLSAYVIKLLRQQSARQLLKGCPHLAVLVGSANPGRIEFSKVHNRQQP